MRESHKFKIELSQHDDEKGEKTKSNVVTIAQLEQQKNF